MQTLTLAVTDSVIDIYSPKTRVPEKELSSHMTRATIPREGDDREDRRGAVQTGGDGAVESASRSGRQPSRLPNEEPG